MFHAKMLYRILRKLPIAALLLTCTATEANAQNLSNLRYQAVWQSGSGSNIVTEPLNRSEFIQRGQELTSQGLRLVDVETERVNGDRVYVGIWVSGSGSNIFDGPMTRGEFRDRREELRAQGLRLIDFEVFQANDGRRRFVGVWRSGSGEERLSLPRNAEDFTALGEDFTSRGLRLVDVEVERNQGELQYRGLWREGTGSNLFSTPQQPADFRALRDQMVADGLELIDMERIGNPGEQEFVSVWASGNGESRLSVPRNFANFITLGEQQTAAGMRTQDFEFFLSDAASTPPDDDDSDGEDPDDDDSNPSNPGSGDDSVPDWVEVSSNEGQVIVDFSNMVGNYPRITLPLEALPESLFSSDDGSLTIPDTFCGIRVTHAESFTWQTQDNQVVTTSPYLQSSDVEEDFGSEFFFNGLSFTGAIGQCEEDNDPWQFNYPLTENSGDSPLANMKLIIEGVDSGSTIEFLDAN